MTSGDDSARSGPVLVLTPGRLARPAPPRPTPPPRARCAYRLRVQLMGIEPAIWRTIEVLGATTLHRLHQIIQAAMGWQDYHLYCFHVGADEYGDPETDEEGMFRDARRARLCDALGQPDSACGYVYDFGDHWRHVLCLEAILAPPAAGTLPRCLAGARACPPEDVGGVPGFAAFLRALRDRRHPEHHAHLEWVGGAYDPAAFDVAAADVALARFRPRMRKPPAAPPTA